jgi:O-antigen/teichoic acid export membrane protein
VVERVGVAAIFRLGESRSFKRTAGLGLLDQLFSSLTNLLLVIVVARGSDPSEFGAFSMALTVYIVLLGLAQASVADVMIVRGSALPFDASRRFCASAAGVYVLIGMVASVAMILMAVVGPLDTSLVRYLAIFAIAIPVLLLQDSLRFAAVTLRRSGVAALTDGIWLVGANGLLIYGEVGNVASSTVVIWWVSIGSSTALLAVAILSITPSLTGATSWIRDQHDLAGRFAIEYGAGQGVSQISVLLIGGIVGVEAAGALRAVASAFGPVNVLVNAGRMSALPWLVRHAGTHRLFTGAAVTSATLGTIAILETAFLLLMPSEWGRMVLGPTWELARTVVLPYGVHVAGFAVAAGAILGLKARQRASLSLKVRLLLAPAMLMCPLAGGRIAGLSGAGWGFAFAGVLAAAAYWAVLTRDTSPMRLASSDPV